MPLGGDTRKWREGTGRGLRDPRLVVLLVLAAMGWSAIVVRLFLVQVFDHAWYAGLASGQRELFRRIYPERGQLFVHDRRHADGRFPIATNVEVYTIVADPRSVRDPKGSAQQLAPLLGRDAAALEEQLARSGRAYEALKRKASREERDAVLALHVQGIRADAALIRLYPDGSAMAQITGFLGEDAQGVSGKYGLEGAEDRVLAGTAGFLDAEHDPRGRWIVFGRRAAAAVHDGADLQLSLERELQLEVCQELELAVRAHGASGGTVVVVRPETGAIRAMCSVPSFDPNAYATVKDFSRFSAPAVTAAYEPGSVFKPITMSAAIEAGAVQPATRFVDTGSLTIGGFTITNTNRRVFGDQSMADVLRFSINTGAVFVAQHLGIDRFRSAVERFGFGALTDVGLSGEVPGDVSNLAHREDVYLATASYGQGITVTPLQLAMAYATIANGGKLMQPQLVEAELAADGTVHRIEPRVVRQVLSPRTATLLQGMLVSVVREGYPKRAGVAGYRVGGKTGTAQIPFSDHPGYSADTIQTFAGIGPVDHPTFAMVIRIDRPREPFADATAAPLFSTIAKFILQYDGIPPSA